MCTGQTWTNSLRNLLRVCTKRRQVAKSQRKTKLYSWPIPESPWSRLHIDFAWLINGQHYVILVDAYSKWPEVFHINHPSSSKTVRKLQEIFSRFGTPEILVSDNGTAFTSTEFLDFCKQISIQHLRVPPSIHNQMVKLNASSTRLREHS